MHILILQHPQEPDKELGSANLITKCLQNCTLRVGLSWPNLTKALGRQADPKKWLVLYLGSGPKRDHTKQPLVPGSLVLVDKKGNVRCTFEPRKKSATTEVATEFATEFDGMVLLDGTWSQAKTLWWRNAWLLKLNRACLIPSRPSLYGKLRKEPRPECLSTIESIAEAFDAIGIDHAMSEQLRVSFRQFLEVQIKRANP